MQNISKSIEACAAHYGEQAEAMRNYLVAGERAALALDNRGPIEFDDSGRLAQHILDAYSNYGFYVFTNVLSEEECDDIEADMVSLKASFPVSPDSSFDANGNPALGSGSQTPHLVWSKPLGDPLGGTQLANGRHQVKMFEPEATAETPAASPFILLGSLRFSDACLRTYAHPELLRVAEAINGADFTPFNEALFIKEPGIGAAVSWHQDGVTHWESPDFDENIHGFNFMAQIYGSTAVNGVWVLPGTHKLGRIDIVELVKQAGTERLPEAVPIICNPGDVVINNRQLVHGSFANTGFETRVTVNFGFHRRSSVLNVHGAGIHAEAITFDDEFIRHRSRLIGLAIQARKQRFPDESPFRYLPDETTENNPVWDRQSMASLKDYNLMDLSI